MERNVISVSPDFIDTLCWTGLLEGRTAPRAPVYAPTRLLLVALSPPCVIANAQVQDSPSLADVARQSRPQKQLKDAKGGLAKDGPTRDPS
jgi:hypothetical protein